MPTTRNVAALLWFLSLGLAITLNVVIAVRYGVRAMLIVILAETIGLLGGAGSMLNHWPAGR